ncbi:cation:dicarboxylase symporter family transporter [Helicobacter sp. 11S03491-1]|uniref:cation:dicarboxylate symporter family transporter n=1 Tax=Helicobacter sp. 11S03491-1 TaxID=1476196 RepID=UPI000BA6CF56|nr:cation:dicarboxylase symporter family transporter [Helicobacter sp. 11S03491-1]PAF42909.1 C4-dicarboxylate ABC transporter [Helicobacter sp. 11S03491-1]
MLHDSHDLSAPPPTIVKKLVKSLPFWVIIGIIGGIFLGALYPEYGIATKPWTIDIFIRVLKWLIGPIIFLTIIYGIMGLDNLKSLGSLGIKAVIYFEVVSTLALGVGLLFGELFRPGHGMGLDISALDASSVSKYTSNTTENVESFKGILLHAIPSDPITPFIHGNTLQVLVMAIVVAIVISFFSRPLKNKIIVPLEKLQNFFFKILTFLMYYSPVAAFGAMAFLIGKFGFDTLFNMAFLVIIMLISCLFFIFVILGIICALAKVNIFKFMRFIAREVLVVFATSSSETALAPLMRKLELAGINKGAVGLVIPTGYSFNLDCTNIYLTLSVIFLSQAFGIPLSFEQTISMIIILMIASKGAVGVTGSGFIVLAGTLQAMGTGPGTIPAVSVAALLGVDKFMSEMRAVGNLCGNSVACMIVSIWDKKIDMDKFRYALDHPEEFRVV